MTTAYELFEKVFTIHEEALNFIYQFLYDNPDFKIKETNLLLSRMKPCVNNEINNCVELIYNPLSKDNRTPKPDCNWAYKFKDGSFEFVCYREDRICTLLHEIDEWIRNKEYNEHKYDVMKISFENKTILITDPCYLINRNNEDDWDKCDYGDNMESLGINNYICRDTIYGDWGCTVWNKDTNEIIGEFCADAGLVIVCDYDEVKAYNPGIDNWIKEHPWCVIKIENFTGNVKFEVIEEDTLIIEGTGNINFITGQTSL